MLQFLLTDPLSLFRLGFLRAGWRLIFLALLPVALSLPGTGRAAVVISVYPQGADVVAVASGTANTAGLNLKSSSIGSSIGVQASGFFVIGTTPVSAYDGFSGPATFGPGSSFFAASSSSGQGVGVFPAWPYIHLPAGYVSGGQISGSSTFANRTLASLGLTPGTYTYTWGSGGNADSLTIKVLTASPLVVTTTSDVTDANDGLTSLREALAYAATLGGTQTIRFNGDPALGPAATGGNIVNFYDGTMRTITVASFLPSLVPDTTIVGPGSDKLTITGTSSVSVLFTASTGAVSVSGLTLDGNFLVVLGISSSDSTRPSVTVADCVLRRFVTSPISCQGALTATGCTFSENLHGMINNNGLITVTDCDLSGNSVTGLLASSSSVEVRATRCKFDNNGGTIGGFGMSGGAVTAASCSFTGNQNAGISGAASAALTDCVLSNNRQGAGVSVNGPLVARNCTMSGNGTSGVSADRPVLVNCEISNNQSGVSTGSQGLVMANCTVAGNTFTGIFGGVTASITNCTVTGNNAGISAGSQYTLANSLVVGNTAANIGGQVIDGGNNLTTGTLAQAGLQVDGNGKALLQNNGGPTRTVALLPTSPAIGAGGVPMVSELQVVNVNGGTGATFTLTFKGAPTGPIAYNASPSTVQAALAGLATIGTGNVTVLGSNSVYHVAFGGTLANADQPALVAAGSGGATATVTTPLEGGTLATDQRGQARLSGAAVDIGAYEAAAPTLFVDAAVSGGNGSGDSWTNAMPALSTATATALTNPTVTQIWVAKGTYKPTSSTTDRDATFQLRNNLAIYGGFTSGQTLLTQRDPNPASNGTTLSGDIDNNDATTGNGGNSYHVVTGSDTQSTAVLDGFTISGGNANSTADGGGMFISQGSPMLTNLIFSGNSSQSSGGGLSSSGGNPTLTNVTFSGNSAPQGGGIYYQGSFLTLTNVTFSGNSASLGGGIYYQGSLLTLTNVTFSGNSAATAGGGMLNNGGSPTLTNVTFSGNSAPTGGGFYTAGGSAKLRNCILWGDSPSEIFNSGGTLTISNSIVQGSSDNTNGNVVLNASGDGPQFVTPITASAPTTTGNLRLKSTSPALNVGNNNVANPALPTTDLDGNARRFNNGTVDLGAYEFSAPVITFAGLTNGALTIVNGSGTFDLTNAQPSASGGTFTASGAAAGAITGNIFNASGVPAGSYTITYAVTNPLGGYTGTATFNLIVAETPSLIVTTKNDSAPGTATDYDNLTSLREALAYAATLTGAQTIKFNGDPSALPKATGAGIVDFYDGTARTILLNGTEMRLNTGTVSIVGPGADRLTLDAQLLSRVFRFQPGTNVSLSGVTMTRGTSAVVGGAIQTDGSLTVTSCAVTDSSSVDKGGGIFSSGGGALMIAKCTFLRNSSGDGGAIFFARSLTLIDSTLAGNSSAFGSLGGGAIHSSGGSALVIGSVFSGNSASGAGSGGAFYGNDGTLTAINSTFSGNSCTGEGGAIYQTGIEATSLSHCTLSGNKANFGGGIVVKSGTLQTSNSVFVGNSAGFLADVAASSFTARGLNLIGIGNDRDGTDGVIQAAALEAVFASVSVNPFTNVPAGTLANNGGPTQTIALQVGSPALDTGGDASTLTQPVTDGTTPTIDVADASAFPAGVGFVIQIEGEQMVVTGKTGNRLTVTRGANGTTPAAHSQGAAVNFAFDQRGAGFPRVLRGKAASPSAKVDIGAYEVAAVPTVLAVSSTKANGSYKAGELIEVTVQFDRAVSVYAVNFVPTLTLATGANAGAGTTIGYYNGDGTDTLIFRYTVAAGDTSADLDYTTTTALALNGALITDVDGFGADLTLPAPGAAGSLGAAKALVIDTTAPTVQISAPSLATTRTTPVTFTVDFADTHLDAITLANANVTVNTASGTAVGTATVAAGTTATQRTVTVANLGGTGTLSITVAAGTASDLAGNLAPTATSATFLVDNAPLVANDFAFIVGKQTVLIDVLANDPAGASGAAGLRIVIPPRFGTATIVAGKVRYLPNNPLSAAGDSFTYEYEDRQGNRATATVKVQNFDAFVNSFDGLVLDETAGPAAKHDRFGYTQFTVNRLGGITGVLNLGGSPNYVLGGTLDSSGKVVRIIARPPQAPVTVTLQLDGAEGTVTGSVVSKDLDQLTFTSSILAESRVAPGDLAGTYTLLLAPPAVAAVPVLPQPQPRGTGYARVVIASNGSVTTTGKLADGTSFSCSTFFHGDGSFPIYSGIYIGNYLLRGSVRGTLAFAGGVPRAAAAASGVFAWTKPNRPADATFPGGFTTTRDFLLARYVTPTASGDRRILAFDTTLPNGTISFTNGGFASFAQDFSLQTYNLVVPVLPARPNGTLGRLQTLNFDTVTGIFRGNFLNPVNKKVTAFEGAVFQANVTGSGFFLGAGAHEAGGVEIAGAR
jgi:hypothetical protein